MIAMPTEIQDAGQLQALLERVREAPELWQGRVRFDEADRVSVSIGGNEHLEVWLICWNEGQSSGMHDHDASHGAAVVVEGQLREDLLGPGGPVASATFGEGACMLFPAGHIHDMTQVGPTRAVTLHAYSPPLQYVGRYDMGAGQLRRDAVPRDQDARYVDGWDFGHALSSAATPAHQA